VFCAQIIKPRLEHGSEFKMNSVFNASHTFSENKEFLTSDLNNLDSKFNGVRVFKMKQPFGTI
jgi:hypothetical protein